jgi:putative membrane protein
MKLLTKIALSALITFILSKILTGVRIDSIFTAIIFAIALSILDAFVKPIIVFLTLPATLITLGLFLFVINAIVVLLADRFVDGIKIDGFWWAMIFSITLSVFDTAIQKTLDSSKK